MADMKKRIKTIQRQVSEEEIDRIVMAQADVDASWERPIHVRRKSPASLAISGELAARAAFLARLHRERKVEEWLERIIRERIELEEVAFASAKQELGEKNNSPKSANRIR
jgi:hypothetical protein